MVHTKQCHISDQQKQNKKSQQNHKTQSNIELRKKSPASSNGKTACKRRKCDRTRLSGKTDTLLFDESELRFQEAPYNDVTSGVASDNDRTIGITSNRSNNVTIRCCERVKIFTNSKNILGNRAMKLWILCFFSLIRQNHKKNKNRNYNPCFGALT
jgi:hypothetical protein